MFAPSGNPLVDLILGALLLIFGVGTGGFVVAVRKDKRLGKIDDVAILDEVRKVAREEVANMRRDLRTERRRTDRLERRVEQLTEAMRRANVPIPDWPPSLRVVGDDVGDEE